MQAELEENGNGKAIFDFDKVTVFGAMVNNAVELLLKELNVDRKDFFVNFKADDTSEHSVDTDNVTDNVSNVTDNVTDVTDNVIDLEKGKKRARKGQENNRCNT